jgi:hypothetical protein
MYAKAAIYGMEKLLRTGITYSAINCNVPLSREKQKRGNKRLLRVTGVKVPKKRALDVLMSFNAEDLAVLDELKGSPGTHYSQTYINTKVFINMSNEFVLV